MVARLSPAARDVIWAAALLCCLAFASAMPAATLTAPDAQAPRAGPLTVTGTAAVVATSKGPIDSGDVVVWLKPVGPSASTTASILAAARQKLKVVQRNKRFEPSLLVVPVGSSVEFPNLDPFFHNVFSMYDGKRFDLGLYEAGTSRAVHLSTPGVCYVFCNIHPEMSAVVVVVDTPYVARSNRGGAFTIADVPAGRYVMHVWHQRHRLEQPGEYPREIVVAAGATNLGTVRLIEASEVFPSHKNKYGRDYLPVPASPVYKK